MEETTIGKQSLLFYAIQIFPLCIWLISTITKFFYLKNFNKLIWVLNNQCLDYTSNNQQILTDDPTNGGWTLSSSNNMSYAFFLVSKLYGSKGNISTCAKLGQFLSDIKSYVDEKDQVNQFLGTIMNALPNSSKNLLNDSDPTKFEQLANLFKMSDDIKNLKGVVESQVKLSEAQGEFNHKSLECAQYITDELVKVRDIAKEGALEEAIAAVKRKIQYRVGKISDLSNRPLDNDAMISKELYEKELELLKDKLVMFQEEWEKMLH